VGAHEIVPDLAAGEGTLTKAGPKQSDWRDIEAGRAAAKAIGELDIGQAAIAIGGRVIALEGIEGTKGLLERTRELRGHGRLAGKIGPQTVEAAHAAGLAGIAVEAGRSLILEGPATLARANALGLFIVGFPATEPTDGQ
ncbi:UDP-2,3-diacylglucosamine diphosphatase LpxI, partial [Mesorhizobium sp.]|uniref:UDP-2,3-diacylglucosamine diphosphatase LpxI domain-containing protein n=1 Tax=Mesorhizobium sp. TaxID=1871066 RepID=UPI000FE469BB